MKIIFLGGINGSGKTAVAERLKKKAHIQVFHGTKELMDLLGVRAGDYEALRRIDDRVKSEALHQFFRNLSSADSSDFAIVTAHYVKILNGEITPSFGPWYKYCTALFFLWAPPASILRRILEDESFGQRIGRSLYGNRFYRPSERLAFLEEAQRISSDVMTRASNLFQLPSYKIENLDDKLERTIDIAFRIIIDLQSGTDRRPPF